MNCTIPANHRLGIQALLCQLKANTCINYAAGYVCNMKTRTVTFHIKCYIFIGFFTLPSENLKCSEIRRFLPRQHLFDCLIHILTTKHEIT